MAGRPGKTIMVDKPPEDYLLTINIKCYDGEPVFVVTHSDEPIKVFAHHIGMLKYVKQYFKDIKD